MAVLNKMQRMRIKNRIIRDTGTETLNESAMQALADFMEVATPSWTPAKQAVALRLALELSLRDHGFSQEGLQEIEDEILKEKDTKK